MTWKISIYEEPGILLAIKTAETDSNIEDVALSLLKGGLEQARNVLALAEKEGEAELVTIYPLSPARDLDFDEFLKNIQDLLGELKVFEAVQLASGVLRGSSGSDIEVRMLAASVFEQIRLFAPAIPLLSGALEEFDGQRLAATQMRLARAKLRSGYREDAQNLLSLSIESKELPQEMLIEALLLRATLEPKEQALETLDQLLDLAEEHLGDHRLTAEALELHADLLSESDEEKSQKFYLAAGKMLLRLQDPYFFNINERLVVHHLKHQQFQDALNLCQEMYSILRDTQGPPVAALPFLVFTAWVHQNSNQPELAENVRNAARAVDPEEVERIEANLKLALTSPLKA